MRKILVTGGAGFIGSSLSEKLAGNIENDIVIVDNLTTGNIQNVPVSKHNNVKFIKGDINIFKDIASIFFTYKFDYVFHFAAVVGVQRTLQNPVRVLRDISGIKNILYLSKNTGVKRVFYSSSSEVYGEPFEIPQNEHTTPLNSRLPYAIVKNVGEAYIRSFKQEYNIDYTIFRFFNTYGPRQSKDFVMTKFIKAAMANADIAIYGDGNQTRTFSYIEDSVEVCSNAFYHNFYVNDVINVGNINEITILELAKMVIKICHSKSKIVFLSPLEEGDMSRRKPDISKMRKLLQRNPLSIEDGIKKLIDHFSHNLNHVEVKTLMAKENVKILK